MRACFGSAWQLVGDGGPKTMLAVTGMNKRMRGILFATVIGLALVAGALFVLARAFDEGAPRYNGQSLDYWVARANSQDAAASNQACLVLHTTIIPQLTETMFHDTNDSQFKLALVERLNSLPGLQISATIAAGRRAAAAESLGQIGPLAKGTIPALLKVLKGKDSATRPAAALALGRIRSEPETVIPLLVALLDDSQDDAAPNAVEGLGQFGGLSKPLMPKLLPLLKSPDKDMRHAASVALKQIDSEAAAKAGVK